METKFRAYDKTNKRMMYFDEFWPCSEYQSLAWHINEESKKGEGSYCLNWDTQNLEIMQFTGLKDKNGKEVYEGDIIKNIPSAFAKEEVIGEIVWFPGHCRFVMNKTNHYLDMINTYEIIGNIYQNPEILKSCDN